MSIFIKGLNVPNKYPIKVIINPTGEAFIDYGPYFETLEVVDVPAPHGRLIDADALPHYTGYALSASEVAKAVEAAPTIIEAEEEQTADQ